MPRVALTAAQRERQALEARARWLANGLAAYKRQEHLTLKAVGKALCMNDRTVSRILDEDYTVRIPIETLWRLEAIARRMMTAEKEVSYEKND